MALSIQAGDLMVTGQTVFAGGVTLPANSVSNTNVAAAAGIEATKLQHQHQQLVAQAHGTAATTERRVIHVVKGVSGSVVNFRAGVVVACVGAATISIRLKKNGSNIDTAATVLDNANAAFAIEAAAGFSSTTLAAGDVLEVDITATAGGGTLGQGLFCELTVREDAS